MKHESGGGSSLPPFHQADANLVQVNPVGGTQYEVLATTANVRIYQIRASVTWTGQPSPLELWLTIDGQTLRFAQVNPNSATAYHAVLLANNAPNAQVFDVNVASVQRRAFLIEGRSVRIQVETTGGVVQSLECRVIYGVF